MIGERFVKPVSQGDKQKSIELQKSYLWQNQSILEKTIILTRPLMIIIWLICHLRVDSFSKQLYQEKTAIKVKYLSNLTYISLILVIGFCFISIFQRLAPIITTQYINPKLILQTVRSIAVFILCIYMYRVSKPQLNFFRTNKPSVIVTAFQLQQHKDFAKAGQKQKAFDSLLKACQQSPDSFVLWSALAHYAIVTNQDENKVDEYLEKAKDLLNSADNPDKKEIADYEYYLSLISFFHQKYELGLEHLKHSIELNPDQSRIELYKKILNEISND